MLFVNSSGVIDFPHKELLHYLIFLPLHNRPTPVARLCILHPTATRSDLSEPAANDKMQKCHLTVLSRNEGINENASIYLSNSFCFDAMIIFCQFNKFV